MGGTEKILEGLKILGGLQPPGPLLLRLCIYHTSVWETRPQRASAP